MRFISRWIVAIVVALCPLAAAASFHLFQISELYSNADGTVQFVELTALSGGQQFLNGHTITSSNGVTTNSFSFTSNLPGDTSGKRFLVGTQGFAALGIVTPDYTVPNGFFFRAGGTINFGEFSDVWAHPATPAPPLSLNRDGSTGINSPLNFAGQTGSIPPPGVIAISPSPVTFSGTSMNTTSPPIVVTITNNHTAAVTISAVAVSGDFGVTPSCGTLQPATSCQAGMTFTPTGEGVRNGTLTVTSTAPGSPHAAPVTGTGERSLVTHYYRSILRREPDAGGKTFWSNVAARVAALGANVNETWFAMAQTFYFSGEYVAFNRNNNDFVTDLYVTFFNRGPDPGGLNFWVGNLNQGMPREVALAEFMFSGEFRNFSQAIFGNPTTRAENDMIVDFYRGLLARLPDDGGFNFWVGRFRAAQCAVVVQVIGQPHPVLTEVEAISSAFTTSGEYTARNRPTAQYVGDLYNAFLRRGGDLGGVQFWINQIDGGFRTRENVRVEFKNSPEFQARVNAVVNQGCMQ